MFVQVVVVDMSSTVTVHSCHNATVHSHR